MSDRTIIAIPSVAPGGLTDARSAHFGQADGFTVVTIENGAIAESRFLPNDGHAHGGCLSPVQLLTSAGTDAIIVSGIGGRPLAGFIEAGVSVYQDGVSATVGESVSAFLAGTLPEFGPVSACGCGGHDHDHGDMH
ncbi:MAG: NifB/NifX family molybdenum-iron cluster-binding protein [Coriobacteriales bacterium]|nr:NifB/NifX family molybdenum-iron cluster-binding protein [Actinomycetes bacterium]